MVSVLRKYGPLVFLSLLILVSVGGFATTLLFPVDAVRSHFGSWTAVIIWIVMYGIFLAFLPFYNKSQWKPSGTYLAFIVAFAIEMFGVPFSMYVLAWIFGRWLPDGLLWGHTLGQYIGIWGSRAAVVFFLGGGLLVFFGWRDIHKKYWSRGKGNGELVNSGIYRYIRHPQYTGFLMITFGMICEWATIPLLVMWPILIGLYYRLAKKEEKDMELEFGNRYLAYQETTSMFLPLRIFKKTAKPEGNTRIQPQWNEKRI